MDMWGRSNENIIFLKLGIDIHAQPDRASVMAESCSTTTAHSESSSSNASVNEVWNNKSTEMSASLPSGFAIDLKLKGQIWPGKFAIIITC